ncbi:hypothetical protein LZ906_015175 [Paraclostridium ghonii]|uniref:hypothetical protein n=1 Tax=Paraclostridium ghonii TaxID=29358 RepID=UPI00202CF067|nr:hypothetical protein [Paeniclostridium ghonii]MCM0167721.1 hypothetical protein [Paeniclostridium ghonii]
MKNLINWMCLISVMGLVLQVMVHINSEIIKDFNKLNAKKSNINRRDKCIGNTRVRRNRECYQEKIAK